MAFRKSAKTQVLDMPDTTFFIDASCQFHIGQLVFKAGLSCTDAWLLRLGKNFKYFSALTKLIQIWRDNARRIFIAWCKTYGPEEANRHARRVPANCIAGRWGSVHSTEQHLMAARPAHVTQMITAVVKGVAAAENALEDCQDEAEAKPSAVVGASARDAIDDVHAEEMAAYRAKMGRWKGDTLKTLADPVFFVVVDINMRLHNPITHRFSFFHKARCHDNLHVKGNSLAELVEGKAVQLLLEFSTILKDTDWLQVIAPAPVDIHGELAAFIVELATQHAASYHRRVVKPVGEFSLMLCWLAHKPMDVACERRKSVARILLDAGLEAPMRVTT